jgi:hypothetical protein
MIRPTILEQMRSNRPTWHREPTKFYPYHKGWAVPEPVVSAQGRADVHPYQFKRTNTGMPRLRMSYRAAKRNQRRVVRALQLSAERRAKHAD